MTTAQSKHGGAKVSLPPPLVFLAFLLLGVALQRLLLPLAAPIGIAVRVLAALVACSVGALLGRQALGLFKRSGQDPKPWLPSPSLVIEGPYRYSRNPMYVAMTAIQIGIGVALNNLWIVALAIPALIVVHFSAVRPEEAYLTERFGESYVKYKATVRRYV
jgi:protein-S-isoprenylcysteine O-methyltransferase Ste14